MTINTRAGSDWILASASPRRSEILSSIGLRFRVDPSVAAEPAQRPSEKPWAYALRLASLKAREVRRRHHRGLVVGADTVVVVGEQIMGKPTSAEDAADMLGQLSARWHEVITGVCLIDCALRRCRTGYARSRVHFRRMSPAEVDWYVRTGEYRDKAGGYAIQGYASLFIDRIEGCYFNIVGFPVATFEKLCHRLGVDLIGQLALGGQKGSGSRRCSSP